MKKVYAGVEIEVLQGDITKQEDLVAIVNAANSGLRGGGGVDGAIHRAAGPQLKEESGALAPISAGDAVITGAYNLPNKYVIHCVGPVYRPDRPVADLLANCYRNALKLAERNKIESIGFPAISTGVYGYPMDEAAEVMFKTFQEVIPGLQSVKKIRVILFDKRAWEIHLNKWQGDVRL
ncbi:MAG: macro domain-containing protein [Syntrophomonadaceae bacterium]|nr:macro domain-containing protein [Syntrophomonadaceae bacterium]MDD3889998.1 macro domain-containing protein [Syntrophomonadaceae bacterium]